MRTLISTGIFRDGDNPEVTIGELCWNFGFNPGILLNMLESANITEETPPIDIAPFKAMPLLELVRMVSCLTVIATYPEGTPVPPWQISYPRGSDIVHSVIHDSSKRAAGTPLTLCLLYTSPSPRDRTRSRMPSSA